MRTIVTFLLWLYLAWCGVAGEAPPPASEVRALMSDIAAGTFREVPSGPVSGWLMTNETGQVYHRADLQAQGRPIIAIGADAIPELVKWLSHTNMHVRYIAHYCLEQITGEEHSFPHFATLKQLRSKGYLKEAESCWSDWYAKRKPKADLHRLEAAARWPASKAWEWYKKQPWLVGCNFLPSTAVNDVEMWQKGTFDPKTIDRELGWAQDLGFNTVRVFINYAVWEADAVGLKKNLRRFLALADKHSISTLVILFDDCFKPEPRVGKQDDPEPGVHNSQWVQSPGVTRRGDRAAWPRLEQYVKDVVGTFASDKRVLAWDLYNEPAKESLPLVEACFRWAREAGHDQPLTTCVYGGSADPKRVGELSDVISFHDYSSLADTKNLAGQLLALDRPVLCTEWMSRGAGSRFETHMPFFKDNRIGCWNWGLVAGRTQTYFPWGSPKGAPEPKLWHHDILRANGAPFDAQEVQFIRVTTGRLPVSALPHSRMLVPTAKKSPVP